jgi:hypothetical protein
LWQRLGTLGLAVLAKLLKVSMMQVEHRCLVEWREQQQNYYQV